MELGLSPLVGSEVTRSDRRVRAILFVCWLALVGWLLANHVFWRDEVRAFSFALSGRNVIEMLKITHGEGHPALWYLILRGAHELFPYREVLPVAGAVFGIASMALVAWFAPFRTPIIGLILFSFYGAFEYVVVSRNYGIAALVMFGLALLYPRIKGSLWLGVLIALLCNTNVPSCLLAAMFLLFRFVELLTEDHKPAKRDWLIFAGNAALALVGALLCFRMIYPTFNDAAVSANSAKIGLSTIVAGLLDRSVGFSNLGFGPILVFVSCFGLIRKPGAFCAAIPGFVALKLFFYFVYPSGYRHEALYVAFLIALYWMTSQGNGGAWREPTWMPVIEKAGTWAFVLLLSIQTILLADPVKMQAAGVPYSRSQDAGELLKQPALRNAIVMADPDVMLESIAYYADNPLYFMRQQRFGKVAELSDNARRLLSFDNILADMVRLHDQTGRPVVFLSSLPLPPQQKYHQKMMYNDQTVVEPESAKRFLASTRLVARLRKSGVDENYDVYVYPK